MDLKILKPRIALNKAFLKVKPNRPEIELFKKNLISLIATIDEFESEEFHKNEVSKFLQSTYYGGNHYINTKDRKDLVIHNGTAASSTVGVIIEAKKPTNKGEMLRPDNINTKAFQELVLYYLRERITHKNLEIKHLIATNIYEWYIFDAQLFEKVFAQNKPLVKKFIDFEEGRSGGNKTDFFYTEIATPAIAALTHEITFTHFDIRDYEKPLHNNNPKDDNLLIALYKLLSPEHLLKLPFANDSNSLDKVFYTELLHIIGLTETKEGGKKLIQRKEKGQRNAGSLIESAIVQLDNLEKISRLEKPAQFGDTPDERLFNVALELSITWINRILFLKLLEAQLIKYHKGNKAYAFLNTDKVKGFDDLNTLFFQVLARKTDERNDEVKQLFANVPYLNSSLFEPTDIEHSCFPISQLKDGNLPVLSNSVIKDKTGKKRTGELLAIEYIFEFLNAYDFSSEGSEEIQEDNKRLINASVLGLIFEKINGYKDGSFFTPGFITMYMCRETIRRAVLQKFNETKGWNCADLHELYDRIEDRKEANATINNLKLCDPAVGSGHFLVSALNEIIAIKSELRILSDRDGKRLKEYSVVVENDELIVTDEDGKLFEYNPTNHESQRVQETLFHEKQTIIENCLFGVDLNPNSVKICRLRLWIELLKNAYYRSADIAVETRHALSLQNGERELETLPNIDINIKCGNSLISRFALDSDLKQALKSSKFSIVSYRSAVDLYRNAENKEQKREMEKLITSIKSDFKSNIDHPFKKTISTARGKVDILATQINTKKQWGEKVDKKALVEFEKAVEKLKKLEDERDDIETNKIYENAFEWRFEFPEVLNDEGDFMGFDVVIGNPPYGLFNKKQNQKIALVVENQIVEVLKKNYPEATGGVINAARIFYAFGLRISATHGFQSMIIPFGILTDTTSVELRKKLLFEHSIIKVEAFPERDSTNRRVFEDVKMSTAILITSLSKTEIGFDIGISYDRKIEHLNRAIFYPKALQKLNPELVQIPLTDTKSFNLLVKIYENSKIKKLGSITNCLTGEVDMTFGKNALSTSIADSKLLKGVQIDKYIEKTTIDQISQGEIEFLNLRLFEKIYSGKKLQDSDNRRIALQGLSGVNEKNRIKATIIEKGSYLANSCNYILQPKELDLEVILAFLNSSLLNFVFKAKSTSSNVNGYEIDDLPFIIDTDINIRFRNIVSQILAAKKLDIKSDTTTLETEIDQLVYQLYGLTEEEVKIVEGKG